MQKQLEPKTGLTFLLIAGTCYQKYIKISMNLMMRFLDYWCQCKNIQRIGKSKHYDYSFLNAQTHSAL